MVGFTWKTSIDSKGRITVPAEIRKRLNLSEKDQVSVSIQSNKVIRTQVGSGEKATQILSEFESVESFNYSEGVLEAVLSE